MGANILKSPATEPEAAHLRGVLRQIGIILEVFFEDFEAEWETDTERTGALVSSLVSRLRTIIKESQRRPRTNGRVIDALTRENGDLESDIIDLTLEVKTLREKLYAAGVGS